MFSVYKNHPVRTQRERCAQTIADLLMSAISLHEPCFATVVAQPISARAVIPSLTYRSGIHPLLSIANAAGMMVNPVLTPGFDAQCNRRIRAGKFAVDPAAQVQGRHVLVIDDIWTTGSNARSAALALRRAGAAAISVLVIGRW
jgi:predicted amidophosphoribosyltransferase